MTTQVYSAWCLDVQGALTIIDSINCPCCKKWPQKLCKNIERQHLPRKAAKCTHCKWYCCIHVSPWKEKIAWEIICQVITRKLSCWYVFTKGQLFYLRLSLLREPPLQHPTQNPGWCWGIVRTLPVPSPPGLRTPGQTPGHKEKHSWAQAIIKEEQSTSGTSRQFGEQQPTKAAK